MTQRFAEVEDLEIHGLPGEALTNISTETKEAYLDAASDIAWSYCEGRGYPNPLPTWGADLRSAVSKIAAWELLVHSRGVNPEDPGHAAIAKGQTDAIGWLRDVAKGVANLQGVSTQRVQSGVAAVITDADDGGQATRGW